MLANVVVKADLGTKPDVLWHIAYVVSGGNGLVPLNPDEPNNCELKRKWMIEASLERRGVLTFRPQYRMSSRKVRRVLTPNGRVLERVDLVRWRDLFPRYLLIGLPINVSLYTVTEVQGIEAILYQDGHPAVIPVDRVEDLMAAVDMGLFDNLFGAQVFKAGQAVEIAGMLKGVMVETDEKMKKRGKATSTINLFGRENLVHTPIDKIKLAS